MTVAQLPLAGAMVPVAYRVQARVQDTADTCSLTLGPVHRDLPPVAPGQFMMVYAFGIGEVPISVSGATAGGEVVLTVRAVGAVSQAICTSSVGSVLGLRGPLGTSWPLERAAGGDVVVVAGGIGLAPLRMLIRGVLRDRDAYAAVSVLYGARTPGDLLYTDELNAWRRSAEVAVTVDAGDGGWRGQVGVVPRLVAAARVRPEAATAFVCGPEVMIDFTVQALLARGVPSERIHLSLERHMDCGIGLCGHCQLGPTLICRDGPVYTHADVRELLGVREL